MVWGRVGNSARREPALPLDRRLEAIAENVPTSLIDELWVFPPLPDRDLTSEFIVLVCFDGGQDRRRILTAQVDAQRADQESGEFEWVQRLREHGTAPHAWVSNMPERLLQRLAHAGLPEVIEICGDAEVWQQAVSRFANGNGGGNGGLEPGSGDLFRVDSRATPTISFSTINECAVPNAPAVETERARAC